MVMALGAQPGPERRDCARLAAVASTSIPARVSANGRSGNWNTMRVTSTAVCLTRSDQVLIFAPVPRARGRREVVPGFGIVRPEAAHVNRASIRF